MRNAVGKAQRILLLGGTSDIGGAIVEELLAAGPAEVILAVRSSSSSAPSAKEKLEAAGAVVQTIDFDASRPDTHEDTIELAFAEGDIDVAIVAFEMLGDAEELWQDHDKAVAAAQINYTGAVSVGVLLAQKFKTQGHGTIVALSSVAGVMVRRSNFVYGSTKAGFDGFFTQLGEALRDSGAQVVVVRPGMVRTKMTEGMKEAPLTVDREQVAKATVAAIDSGTPVVWCHPAFRVIMGILKNVPQPILRKLPI